MSNKFKDFLVMWLKYFGYGLIFMLGIGLIMLAGSYNLIAGTIMFIIVLTGLISAMWIYG